MDTVPRRPVRAVGVVVEALGARLIYELPGLPPKDQLRS
jgi:hypothetical protein